MMKAIIPDDDTPHRSPDGVVEGENGQTFFFWLGKDGYDSSDELDGDDAGDDEEGA